MYSVRSLFRNKNLAANELMLTEYITHTDVSLIVLGQLFLDDHLLCAMSNSLRKQKLLT